MIAPDVLAMAKRADISIALDGDDLVLKASAPPDPDLLELLTRHKAGIVRLLHDLAAWTDEDWRAVFDERAGFLEFDGGSTRAEAENRANEEVAALRKLLMETPDG